MSFEGPNRQGHLTQARYAYDCLRRSKSSHRTPHPSSSSGLLRGTSRYRDGEQAASLWVLAPFAGVAPIRRVSRDECQFLQGNPALPFLCR